MKEYLIDLGMGAAAGIVCFVVAWIVAAISFGNTTTLIVSLIILVILGTYWYSRSGLYKKNHQDHRLHGIIIFFCSAVLICLLIFGVLYLVLAMSFARAQPEFL